MPVMMRAELFCPAESLNDSIREVPSTLYVQALYVPSTVLSIPELVGMAVQWVAEHISWSSIIL